MSYITLSFENLSEYKTFENKSDMDSAIYEHIDRLLAEDAPRSVIEVLRFFGRSSLRILGISFAKYQTIADALNISKRTVIRAVNTLEQAEIIEKVATVKKWRRSVNVIRILPVKSPQDVTSEESPETNEDRLPNSETSNEPITLNQLNNTSLDTARALKATIPTSMYNALSPFFNADQLYNIVGVLYRAKATVDRSIKVEDHAEYIDVFISAIRRYKSGHIRNLANYLYVAWRKCSRAIMWREMAGIYT